MSYKMLEGKELKDHMDKQVELSYTKVVIGNGNKVYDALTLELFNELQKSHFSMLHNGKYYMCVSNFKYDEYWDRHLEFCRQSSMPQMESNNLLVFEFSKEKYFNESMTFQELIDIYESNFFGNYRAESFKKSYDFAVKNLDKIKDIKITNSTQIFDDGQLKSIDYVMFMEIYYDFVTMKYTFDSCRHILAIYTTEEFSKKCSINISIDLPNKDYQSDISAKISTNKDRKISFETPEFNQTYSPKNKTGNALHYKYA